MENNSTHMNYSAKQLKKAQAQLAKLDKAIEEAPAKERAGIITFDEEVALWNEAKELRAFIEYLEPFVEKLNRAL